MQIKAIVVILGAVQVGIAAALGFGDWSIAPSLKGGLVIAAAVVAYLLNSLPSLTDKPAA